MSSPKTNCLKCGAEFLQTTADRTGGVCMRCAVRGPDGTFVPPVFPAPPPPPRPFHAILAEIQTRTELFGNASLELRRFPPSELPPAVQCWLSAHTLMSALGNGWSDVVWQYLDDLVAGVAGFRDCGFEIGVQGGEMAMQILDTYFQDWHAPGFRFSFTDDPLEISGSVMSEGAYNSLYDDFRRLDDQLMSETWARFGDLEVGLIARARALAASAR